MRLKENDREIEVAETPLVLDLLHKWGYSEDTVEVTEIKRMTSEFNAWGIPWKWRC